MEVIMTNYSGTGYNELEHIEIQNQALISVDGSTTVTGLSILEIKTRKLIARMRLIRDSYTESPVRYKLELKCLIVGLLGKHPSITHLVYEEPIVRHIASVKNLFMLRSFAEEIKIENEPKFDYLQTLEIGNTRWKTLFLYPTKIKNNTEEDKKLVNAKVKLIYNLVGDIDYNETDSIGLGYVSAEVISGDRDAQLVSEKKPTKFKYNIVFQDIDDTDKVVNNLKGIKHKPSIPQKLLEQSPIITDLGDRSILDKAIYKELQEDDKVLILRFKVAKHSDILLEHSLTGYGEHEYAHAVVWRNKRKKFKTY